MEISNLVFLFFKLHPVKVLDTKFLQFIDKGNNKSHK